MSSAHELGERKIIEIIEGILDKMPNMPIQFGDDVSAIDIGDGKLAVLKVDMLVGKTDVPPGMSMRQAARKTVVMNVSDFAAKGVKPIAILTSLGLPKNTSEIEVEEIAKGLNEGAREYGAYIIGGDTSEASELIINCMLTGTAKREEIVLRSTAKPGDILAVTGYFGKTSSGLKILLEGLKVKSPELRNVLVDSVYTPKAHLKEGLALTKSKAVSASIDSSDGLAISLYWLRKMSNVGFRIFELPAAPEVKCFAEEFNLNLKELVLYGGEEYELVVTIDKDNWDLAQKAVKKVGGNLIQIGEVTKKREIVLNDGKVEEEIQIRGWEHFK
jgi:thiamine-monophosphate kinase